MTSVAGQLKNLISTVIGAFAFGDFSFSFVNVVGLTFSACGAVWYAVHSTLKPQQKTELLPTKPSQDSNGYVNDKLKNYTNLSNGNGKLVIPVTK